MMVAASARGGEYMPGNKILITGAGGQVGLEAVRRAPDYGFTPIGLTRAELDISDAAKVMQTVKDIAPTLLINCAAYTQVDQAESEPDKAHAVNGRGAKNLALACQAINIPLFHLSTDYVFDGNKTGLYLETDTPNPTSIYGATKLAGEQAVIEHCKQYIILRTAWVYGTDGHNFIKTMLDIVQNHGGQKNGHVSVVNDQFGSPTFARDIAKTLLEIAQISQNREHVASGIYHYTGDGTTSWYGFADIIFKELAAQTNIQVHLSPTTTKQYPTPKNLKKAKRPINSALDTTKISNEFNIFPIDWIENVIQVTREIIKQKESQT